jgi:hypothetical protein
MKNMNIIREIGGYMEDIWTLHGPYMVDIICKKDDIYMDQTSNREIGRKIVR